MFDSHEEFGFSKRATSLVERSRWTVERSLEQMTRLPLVEDRDYGLAPGSALEANNSGPAGLAERD